MMLLLDNLKSGLIKRKLHVNGNRHGYLTKLAGALQPLWHTLNTMLKMIF